MPSTNTRSAVKSARWTGGLPCEPFFHTSCVVPVLARQFLDHVIGTEFSEAYTTFLLIRETLVCATYAHLGHFLKFLLRNGVWLATSNCHVELRELLKGVNSKAQSRVCHLWAAEVVHGEWMPARPLLVCQIIPAASCT